MLKPLCAIYCSALPKEVRGKTDTSQMGKKISLLIQKDPIIKITTALIKVYFQICTMFTRLIHPTFVETNIILFTDPPFNVGAASVIHRTGAPRLWWGHSHRVNQPLPHTVPVSQTSHGHSSAPSTKPKTQIQDQLLSQGESWSQVRVCRANLNHHKSYGYKQQKRFP